MFNSGCDGAWHNECEFEKHWDAGLAAFVVRMMNSKRNQQAQTIKNKMFGHVGERKVSGTVEFGNCGIGLKPTRSTHDDIADWVTHAKTIIPW